jgi:hypothetical protein
MAWCGWLWRGKSWEKVCQADTIGDTSRMLLAIAKGKGIRCTHQVITGGVAPTFTPACRGRARPGSKHGA